MYYDYNPYDGDGNGGGGADSPDGGTTTPPATNPGPKADNGYNGGSPPNQPLQSGYGWEWQKANAQEAPGSDGGAGSWVQVQGRGIGYVATNTPPPGGGDDVSTGPDWDNAHDRMGGYYDANGKWVGGSPRHGAGGGGGGKSGGGGVYGGVSGAPQGSYDFPQLRMPSWGGYADLGPPPEFAYENFDPGDPFKAPDPNTINNDPSYQWRFGEGQRALETSKAGQGMFRTGATMKALAQYGQNFASTEYGDIYKRSADTYDRNLSSKFGAWNANRSNKLDAYKTNWGIKTDAYDRNYADAVGTYDRAAAKSQAEFAPQQRWAELQFGRDWDLYKYANDDAFRKYELDRNIQARIATGPNT